MYPYISLTEQDVKNYAKFQLKCVVPQDAKSATRKIVARVVYYYIWGCWYEQIYLVCRILHW